MVKPRIVAIVQARMSSSRLPGKVLMPLANSTVVEGVLKRMQQSKVDDVVLATSNDCSDDVLASFVVHAGFSVVRGSLTDVLSRFHDVAAKYPADHYVRITADCPFIDPALVNDLIDHYLSLSVDYASNAIEPSLPDGFDCEVFSAETLMRVNKMARQVIDREHVTHYIYTHPELFKVYSHTYDCDFSGYRVTLDTSEDYLLIQNICESLPCTYLNASLADILLVFKKKPELLAINNMYRRNEGLQSD